MVSEEIQKQIIRDFADSIFSKSQENIVEMEISDTGALLLSGEIRQEGVISVIEYTAPYSDDVNSGTKPHLVEPEDLEGWVWRKLLERKGTRDSPKVKRRAKLISDKIKRFGTQPKPFFNNALEFAKVKYRGTIDLR